ncbi:hypothetical protein BpHYR1_015728 [Brachionus plicatilis]|uniref:Uncharacterized protein n=1 Tax=Brachionus plicatilis TaxID=10195 RepID=A0A3M7RP22_BRAPC|nr:hypothetical protein BpHYR1_015728 [Brachionus plicatilis]
MYFFETILYLDMEAETLLLSESFLVSGHIYENGRSEIKIKRLGRNITAWLQQYLRMRLYSPKTNQQSYWHLIYPRPNNGQRGRPSRPVCGSEPADLGDPSSLFFLIISECKKMIFFINKS